MTASKAIIGTKPDPNVHVPLNRTEFRYNPTMASASDTLWRLTQHNGGVRTIDLMRALSHPELPQDPNPRTPLLVRDALRALESKWGSDRLRHRLAQVCSAQSLYDYAATAQNDHGFPSLERRTMDTTEPDDVLALFRELGSRLREPAELVVGGSTALILAALIVHRTEDIDVVNEVPATIRNDYQLLETLQERFPLQLTHFQSHYLPQGWPLRTRSLGQFGSLSVRVIDVMDVLVGKIFSRRNKDYVHVAEAWKLIDPSVLRERLSSSTANLRADEPSRQAAVHNWYVLTGESELPGTSPID